MIFVTTALYSLAKKLGLTAASEEFMRQVGQVAEGLAKQRGEVGLAVLKTQPPPLAYVPAAYTVARVCLLDEIQVNINAGATVIAKARNIAAHSFLESPCDVWISVDDDVEVSVDALATMVEQCRKEQCIVVAPCLLRDSLTVNIEEHRVALEHKAPNGGRLQALKSGGFGCVAMARSALEAIVRDRAPWTLDWTHSDGIKRRVLFRDEIEAGKWYTEDTAFFLHLPASVAVWAVRNGRTVHNGQALDLATLEALVKA
jgi:hypothetical protein